MRGRGKHLFVRARWPEYRRLLTGAREAGYDLLSLEDWIEGRESPKPFILRHDVDQHPQSALKMALIERELDVRSTWYFRWRTANARVIARIRRAGGAVGFHYETLTRRALASPGADPDALVEDCRRELRWEVAEFVRRFGAIRSAAPHGDTRVPGVTNAVLLRGEDPRAYGLRFDANDAMRDRRPRPKLWLTDLAAAEGGWGEGGDPLEACAASVAPILCLTHPDNWASGPSLLMDRLTGALLPAPEAGRTAIHARPVRTGVDRPPARSRYGARL